MNLIKDTFEFGLHTQIYFGVNRLAELPEIIKKYNYENVLICTDKGIAHSGALDRLESILKEGNIKFEVFDEVEPDPTIRIVKKVEQIFTEKKCDALIGFGGGSSIDIAKGISIAVANPGSLNQFEGKNKIPNKGPDVIAIPTTAGTGSEVTHATVLKDEDRKYKMGILSEHLHPKAAILDPVLLTTLPKGLATMTGMDALSHAIESYTSNQAQPITEALGLYAIELIGKNLRPFAADRSDIEAASNMMLASTIAGAAFIWGRVAAVHALSHPLGGRYKIPHGLANSMLLPVVMKYNVSSNFQKFRNIAFLLGENVEGITLREAAGKSVTAVENLISDLDIPTTLKEIDIELSDEEVQVVAEEAYASGIANANPKQVSVKDLVSLIHTIL
ncbi:iron-containing alcohol dehydrogenase [Metabacillus idriensis]|uniref:Iron-containing alcohol dehydrogenase n=1 Tax=Metabacillus idriensis TaxID=324768 RepID=A0A6I2MGC9_9BACI|nr:iron-containing alcohol dehydrogenase [Metabacillus idriensis]MCM3598043.1 iron-containing alcohol dehydrogenase [Metabacillus idriensis]MRX56849.1 iron-containing alcohol dehydrogenase [Metabacillus idriensis]